MRGLILSSNTQQIIQPKEGIFPGYISVNLTDVPLNFPWLSSSQLNYSKFEQIKNRVWFHIEQPCFKYSVTFYWHPKYVIY